jgi:hypothetical protein
LADVDAALFEFNMDKGMPLIRSIKSPRRDSKAESGRKNRFVQRFGIDCFRQQFPSDHRFSG